MSSKWPCDTLAANPGCTLPVAQVSRDGLEQPRMGQRSRKWMGGCLLQLVVPGVSALISEQEGEGPRALYVLHMSKVLSASSVFLP